jgi:hypothetical protein
LRRYAESGGTLLFVVIQPDIAAELANLMGSDPIEVEEVRLEGYTMLGEIDFDHPLFAAMAGPQFNDFTQIRFWKYRRIKLNDEEARVLARFEQGDPALIEKSIGKGRLLVLASGWQPGDSQLSRSWKFLLMISTLAEGNDWKRSFRTQYLVNERVTLPARLIGSEATEITKPDGTKITLEGQMREFDGTDQPGVYSAVSSAGELRFVVHVDPRESETAPLPSDAFAQLGCRLSGEVEAREAAVRQQMRDVELESRQKLWQWLVAGVMGVLIVETWLAGHLLGAAT